VFTRPTEPPSSDLSTPSGMNSPFVSGRQNRWVRFLESTRRNPRRTDIAITVLLMVGSVLSNATTWAVLKKAERDTVARWAIPMLFVALIPSLWRRNHPELSMLATTLFIGIAAAGHVPDGLILFIAIWIAIYSVGAYGGRHRDAARVIAIVLISILLVVILRQEDPNLSAGEIIVTLVINLFYAASAWLFGETMRFRRTQTEDLRARTNELEMRTIELVAERETNAKRAVLDERVRIARELHDVVAHHVSLMGVQASAARHVLTRDPEKAASALSHIESSSREAVEELQRLLGFLRNEETIDSIDPQPSLARISELIETGEQSGLRITTDIADVPTAALQSSVDLSAFRIVQEALTNVRKHAGPTDVSVSLHASKDQLNLRIVNGPPAKDWKVPAQTSTSHHGITGMRERARLVGGTLHAGATPEGGWEVLANLPTRAPSLTGTRS
jgi:signal transduction histidine kinase